MELSCNRNERKEHRFCTLIEKDRIKWKDDKEEEEENEINMKSKENIFKWSSVVSRKRCSMLNHF